MCIFASVLVVNGLRKKNKKKYFYKICSKCKRSKPKKEFYKKNSDKPFNSSVTDYCWCEECRRNYNKQYYKDKALK